MTLRVSKGTKTFTRVSDPARKTLRKNIVCNESICHFTITLELYLLQNNLTNKLQRNCCTNYIINYIYIYLCILVNKFHR